MVPPVVMYQLRLIGPAGKVVAIQRLSALTDAEAVAQAQARIEGSVSVADFDLWQGERRVHMTRVLRQRKRRR